MLSYRHAYHAGNFADVLKHAVLTRVILALQKKPAPFCYIDTHAGAARYDLHSESALKTGEYKEGIARLWGRSDVPDLLTPYLQTVRAENPGQQLNYYPGSPRIVRHLMRDQDRMVLMELHTTEYPLLKQAFAHDSATAVHHMDGYQGISAWLPPKEKRGVMLIDPSYETKDEFHRVVEALAAAYARWSTGVLCLWYPVLDRGQIKRMEAELINSDMREVLLVELNVMPDASPPGLHGCGMVIVRPPYRLDEELRQLLPWLQDTLVQVEPAQARVKWLISESGCS